METYTAATGAVNYWVKVPVLSHTTDTTIYLCYGNASVTTDQSNKTAVWDANYKGVWHLPNGTTLNASDSSANGNSGTITGAVATAGKSDGAASLNGTSDHIQVKAGKVDTSAATGTVSAWVKVSALDKNGVVLGYGGGDAALWGVYIREVSGSYYFAIASRTTNAGVYNTVRGNTVLTTGTWYYVTYSTNGSVWKIRVNGSTAQTLTAVFGTNTGDWIGDISTSTPDKSDIGGIYAGGAYSSVNYWNGTLDEVRLSNVARSDDWVATEYNNQSSPSTFYTLSSVTSLVPPSQVQWLVADQLGTPRMIVDETGALANMKRHDYLPFGEELLPPTGGRNTSMGYTSDGIRHQFTAKERDVETGLDYFLARYYSSIHGRFTSPDPFGGSGFVSVPQSWNKYAYCLNRPLVFIDPSGMVWLTNDDTFFFWVDDDKYKKHKEDYAGYSEANGAVGQVKSCTDHPRCNHVREGDWVEFNKDGTIRVVPDPTTTIRAQYDEQLEDPQIYAQLGMTRTGGRGYGNPLTGPPNGNSHIDYENGGSQTRYYDGEGRPYVDVDRGHDHGAGDPHVHWWDWNNPSDPRGDGEAIPYGWSMWDNGDPIPQPRGSTPTIPVYPVPFGAVPTGPVPVRPTVPIRPVFLRPVLVP